MGIEFKYVDHKSFEKDCADTIALYKECWYENMAMAKNTDIVFNPKAELFASIWYANPCVGITARDTETNKLVGQYWGLLTPHHFDDNLKICQELCWGIHPEYRTPELTKQLLDMIGQAMAVEDVDLWELPVEYTDRMKAVSRFMKREGYFPVDINYIKYRS